MNTPGGNLNADQRRAVEHSGGSLLVLAGPGTGKTKVLVSRVAHLILNRKVSPDRILALTFSRRASEEMEERLKAESEAAARVRVSTFHSFALRMVRRHYRELGLANPPGIIPTSRQWQLVREILALENPADWNLAPDAFSRSATIKEIYDLLLRARENSCGPNELRKLGEEHHLPYLKRAGAVLAEYTDRLNRASEVDYEQVVQQTLELLRSGREEVTGRYDHVLVDEFQDTNRSQLDFVKLLMPGDNPNIFCVGDDAQSIYGFRGARAENVSDFKAEFPGAEVVPLRINYRSAQPIVSLSGVALAVDEIAMYRAPQQLPGTKAGSVFRRITATNREEGEWISDRILELNSGGLPFDEIAVLRRSLLDSEPLIEAMRSRGIPVDFSNTPARTSAGRLAILLLAASGEDPNPRQASRALISPLVGLPPESARSLRDSAQSSSMSVFGMIRAGNFPASIPEEDRTLAAETLTVVDSAREVPDFLEKLDLLWKNLPGTRRLFDSHRTDPDSARAIADTAAFVRAAKSYAAALTSHDANRRPDAEGFLAAGDPLDDDSDTWAPQSPPVSGAVRVMTVHGSKGLEFEAVFVSGLSQGRFPVVSRGVRFVDTGLLAGRGRTSRQQLEESHLREERRLFYVALTRAKTHLYLSGVEEDSSEGEKASDFMQELEAHLATLAAPKSGRRFWASRDEAVEELRRLAFATRPDSDDAERFAACRALAEMDERPTDGQNPWWSYVEVSSGEGASPPATELRERELVDLAKCPRRAFLSGLSRGSGGSGRSGYGGMYFGAAFGAGFEEFLGSGRGSLIEVLRETVESGEFGGPAFREHWLREVEKLDPSCDEWARGIRENLVSGSGTWTSDFAGRRVSGRHGPMTTDEKGRTVLNKVSSGRAKSHADADTDLEMSLQVLATDSHHGEFHYPRHISYKKPAIRVQGKSEGWREDLMIRLEILFESLNDGDHPPNPEDESLCGRCAFRVVCPAHRSDEYWLDSGIEKGRNQ